MKTSSSAATVNATAPSTPDSLTARLVDLLGRRLRRGTLQVETPRGERLDFGDGGAPQATWQLRHPRALWRLLTGGALGFAEGYLAGDWDTPDLMALLDLAAANEAALGAAAGGRGWLALGERLRHRLRANSRRQAQRNIAYHYDLGNDFYAAWLDDTMTYSAAVFATPDEPLEQAQGRKYTRLADLAGVAPGRCVLEVGCGWGGFMSHAATRGADVTGLSISAEQVAYANARMQREGLAGRARAVFRDYRDASGSYESIVSIEMFEAVGEAYWDTYARQLACLLAPGGRAALQVITIEPARFDGYRHNPDFIQRHVFPGGMLPSEPVLHAVLERAGLAVVEQHACGYDYARTLARWRTRFEAAWPTLTALGFDERFRRLWRYYLCYCEAGFMHDAIDVVQLGVTHR
ncbi:MAG: class I SAM-dependent methyltransferase [Gammaproteobacteria bacterium]